MLESTKRYSCLKHGIWVMVTRAGEGELDCEGIPLVIEALAGRMKTNPRQDGQRSQLGHRYRGDMGAEVLVIGPGDCLLQVDGVPMEELEPKILSSAD